MGGGGKAKITRIWGSKGNGRTHNLAIYIRMTEQSCLQRCPGNICISANNGKCWWYWRVAHNTQIAANITKWPVDLNTQGYTYITIINELPSYEKYCKQARNNSLDISLKARAGHHFIFNLSSFMASPKLVRLRIRITTAVVLTGAASSDNPIHLKKSLTSISWTTSNINNSLVRTLSSQSNQFLILNNLHHSWCIFFAAR